MTPARLLIVEDEALVALDLETRLQQNGYTVVGVCDTGPEAIAVATRLRPDLVLMDIHLAGGSDGITAAQAFRETLRSPVVFLTAYADTDTLSRAGAAAPYGYIVKPFEERSVIATIEMALARRNAELKLEKMESWLSTTLHSIGDAVVSVDLDGRINYFNPEAERLSGWLRHEALGRDYREVLLFVHEELGMPAPPHPIAEAFATGLVIQLDPQTELVTKAGSKVPVDDSAAPTRDKGGEMTGVVIVIRDRTERRAADEARRKIEQKMQDAQRLESLGVMAGGIAHDFNNLLAAMMLNAELISTSLPREATQQAGLADIVAAGQRASELCYQMLAYAGKGKFLVAPFSLSLVVEDTISLLKIAISKNAELRLDLAPDLPAASGDTSQIRQVIMNLVINASDALGEKEGVISVLTRSIQVNHTDLEHAVLGKGLPEGEYLLLEVRDTGSGMSPETMARIFDPFFTTKFTGRGLGLAAVLGIIRSHGGALLLESELGRGTCFRVLVPVAGIPATEPPPAAVASEEPWQGRGTVLVIDDEAPVRAAAALVLETLGFQVLRAGDGVEALEILARSNGQVRLVLTDLTMPRMNGFETTREISRLYPTLPVLVMSGFSEQTAGERFAQLPIRGFLQKPFTMQMLQSAVQSIIP